MFGCLEGLHQVIRINIITKLLISPPMYLYKNKYNGEIKVLKLRNFLLI
jgi:hypothetical protein